MDTKQCPMCGEEILAVAKKCKHCGEYFTDDGSALGVNAKSRLAFILLGLFFGGIGVHNAYIGHPVRGLLQVLLMISGVFMLFLGRIGFFYASIVWIAVPLWILLEICLTTKDSNGVPLK